jgi:xanthine dehydrogenase accessory factor
VLAERPTSAHPGDEALILPDGTMEGFVGGECAEATVRAQALAALDSGEPVLLRITPTPEAPVAGKVVAHNPCLSGGTLEIFLQPRRPPPRVAVFGDGPIAGALHTIGRALGYDVVDAPADLPAGLAAVVVASHGRDEAIVLATALAAGVDYVGLVASPKRGAAVVAELDAPDAERVVTPAGLDIGARTAEEVALSIFADVVARRARPSARPARETTRSAAATEDDPVCGMEVPNVDSSLHLDHDGTRYWFCGTGCLRAFAAEPARYLGG